MNMIIADVIRRHPSEIYLQIHATSPFVQQSSFDAGYVQMMQEGMDSTFATTEIQSRASFGGSPVNFSARSSVCSQDTPPITVENSGFYFFTREAFLKYGARICGENGEVPLKPWEAIDIDTESDWRMAEAWADYTRGQI